MTPVHPLGRRVAAVEARLADVEEGFGDTLYKLHRASVRTDLRIARILDRLEVQDVTDRDVDAAMDES